MSQETNQQQTEAVEIDRKEAFLENSEQKTPLGVKIISIIFFILSILILLASFFILPFYYNNLVASLFFGIYAIFLWKKYNFARILLIIMSFWITIAGILFSFILEPLIFGNIAGDIMGIFLEIVYIVIGSLIFIYLSFNKKVKLAFNPENKLKIKDIFIAIHTTPRYGTKTALNMV